MHSTELLTPNSPNRQKSCKPEENLSISLLFFLLIIYLFTYHEKDEVKPADAIYKICSQHRALVIQKATVPGLYHCPAPPAGHRKHRRVSLGGACHLLFQQPVPFMKIIMGT